MNFLKRDRNIFLIVFVAIVVLFTPFLIKPSDLVRRSGDASDLAWPNYYFIKDSIIHQKEVPLWNPYLFSGVPEIANPQSPLLYLPNALVLVMDLDLAIVILFILHLFMAFIFMYFIGIQKLKWGRLASFVLAATFTFSPYFWGRISVGHISLFFAITLITPILYFGVSLLQKSTTRSFWLLSIFLCLEYLNYPTFFFYAVLFGLLSVGLYLLLLKTTLISKIKRLSLFSLSVGLSILIIFPLFFSQFRLGNFITRSELTLLDISVPVFSVSRFVKSVILPFYLLNDLEIEVWMYPSIIALILAVFAFIKLSKKFKVIILIISLLILIITLGVRTPIFGLMYEFIPFFSFLRVTTRDWFIFIVLISFLSGFAFTQIKHNFLKKGLLIILLVDLIGNSAVILWNIPDIMKADQVKSISSLIMHDSSYRYYCTRPCFSFSESVIGKIRRADGYHPLVSKGYAQKISEAGGFELPNFGTYIPNYLVEDAQPSAEKLGDFSVKWVLSPKELVDKNFSLVKVDKGLRLYENKLAKPRIRFENNKNNQIKIIKDGVNNLSLKTDGDKDTLIAADSYFPGWEVFVNGEKQDLIIWDGWARAVKLDTGGNRVEFKYNPLN